MSLNPRIFTNAGSYYLEWDADILADCYRMTAPDGSIHQVGKAQTVVKLGRPTQPFTVSVAADYPAVAESVTVGDTPPPPPPVTFPRYGGAPGWKINTRTTTDRQAELQQWKDVGAQYIRTDLAPSDQWDASFKDIYTRAAGLGLKVVACLRGSSGPCGATEAARFSTEKIQRYPGVLGWEWINEPNLKGIKSAPYTPQQYATEMIACHDALKKANPNANVIAGGMGWDSSGDFNVWGKQALDLCKGHYDLISAHPYGDPKSGPWKELFSVAWDKPVIATESGVPTFGQSWAVSPAVQAQVVVAALHDPRLVSCCTYTMRDDDVPGFGILGMPAYAAYQQAAA